MPADQPSASPASAPIAAGATTAVSTWTSRDRSLNSGTSRIPFSLTSPWCHAAYAAFVASAEPLEPLARQELVRQRVLRLGRALEQVVALHPQPVAGPGDRIRVAERLAPGREED